MENMFSNKTNKTIPQTLSDCIKPDPTVTNLYFWAERLENWGHILFCIIAVVGLVASIFVAVLAADEAYRDKEVIAFICSFAGSALTWALFAFLEYCAYHSIALLIGALACITQNTIITADTALFSASQNRSSSSDSAEDAHSAPAPAPAPTPKPFIRPQAGSSWICTCGQHNDSVSQFCKNCGKYK